MIDGTDRKDYTNMAISKVGLHALSLMIDILYPLHRKKKPADNQGPDYNMDR